VLSNAGLCSRAMPFDPCLDAFLQMLSCSGGVFKTMCSERHGEHMSKTCTTWGAPFKTTVEDGVGRGWLLGPSLNWHLYCTAFYLAVLSGRPRALPIRPPGHFILLCFRAAHGPFPWHFILLCFRAAHGPFPYGLLGTLSCCAFGPPTGHSPSAQTFP
jgi:hypothetical protein